MATKKLVEIGRVPNSHTNYGVQLWNPSQGASNVGVNSECFAQKLRNWSKTPSFGVTKNSEFMVTTKLVKIGIVLHSHKN